MTQILDPTQAKLPRHALDRAFVKTLNDPRDLPFVHLLLQCSGVALLGVALYFIDWLIVFLPFAALYVWLWTKVVLDRYTWMLQSTAHRPVFKERHRLMNQVLPVLLAPFFGQTPETYSRLRPGLHRPGSGPLPDVTKTLPYQRDRFRHWLSYFLRYFSLTAIELTRYHKRSGRKWLDQRTVTSELMFWGALIVLMIINLKATLVVFVVPIVVIRFLMLARTWGQHAFVDPSDPTNPYRSSVTCINTSYNERAFNDGYPITRHVKPHVHWTECPTELTKDLAKYAEEDAVVFEGIDFYEVRKLLMKGRYGPLARRFVRLPGAPERTEPEVIELLKSRAGPVPLG